jgi:hypothetical protein
MLKSVLSKEIQIYVKTNIVYKIYLAASCLDLVSGLKQVVSCLICPQARHIMQAWHDLAGSYRSDKKRLIHDGLMSCRAGTTIG